MAAAQEQGGRRVALVTGASRGIGKAAALALADAGFDVAITARTRAEGSGIDDSDVGRGAPLPGSIELTLAEIEGRGVRGCGIVADLLEPTTMLAAAEEVLSSWGRIDVLVNNAIYTGPGGMVPFLELSEEQMTTRLAGNVVSQLLLTQLVVRSMLERGGGRVIDVSSHVAVGDPPAPVGQGGWGLGYAASKAAFHKMAPIVAVELGERGISAFNVDPGYVETEKQLRNAERNGLAGHYAGAPPTVPGRVIAWLAGSDEALALSGQLIRAQKVALERGLHPDWRA